MNENWLQAYILLAFRIHKVVQATYGDACLFVESYYGPQAWREQAESEPQTAPADLVRQAFRRGTIRSRSGAVLHSLYVAPRGHRPEHGSSSETPDMGAQPAYLCQRLQADAAPLAGARQDSSLPVLFDGTNHALAIGSITIFPSSHIPHTRHS
jgi:hypothetical protein